MLIRPITCYRPDPKAAASFAAPPYDVFDSSEAAAYVAAHPGSFLAIDRPETAFGPGQDPYAPEVYEKAGELVRRAAYEGTLLKDVTPCLYLYRLQQGEHAQLGIVAACSVREYEEGTIRRHELTRPDKTSDRVRHIQACAAQTGPVFLAYRDSFAIDVITDAARASSPLYDFTDDAGTRHTVWRIARPVAVEALQVAFTTVPCAYIADGHHRASAAAEVCRLQHAEATDSAEELDADYFLAVLFPASQLRVLPYNRVVCDRNGLSPDELLDGIKGAGFAVAPAAEGFVPTRPRDVGILIDGAWYELTYEGVLPDEQDGHAAALDVSIVQDRILGPLLGIDNPRTSKRIKFVGGNVGPEGLAARAGSDGVALSLCPTSVDDLMRVSDAGELMPPKSTWFEPKLLSGLFIRRV